MPSLGDGDGFLRDEYAHMYEHEQLHDGEGNLPPVLQDSGLTLNFKKTDDDHYDKIQDILHDLSKSKMVHFSKNELRSMESELEKEQDHDQMTADFHGIRFHFNRDEAPSHWSAQQMAYDQYGDSQSTVPSIPELAYYGIPLLLLAITVFVVMCGVGIVCGCIAAHYRSQQKKRNYRSQQKKRNKSVITSMLKYKAVPNEDVDRDWDAAPGDQFGDENVNNVAAEHIDL